MVSATLNDKFRDISDLNCKTLSLEGQSENSICRIGPLSIIYFNLFQFIPIYSINNDYKWLANA